MFAAVSTVLKVFLPLLQAVMAKAKYRNIADTPDELSFGQGDIVTILEKNYGGLDGWWLCQLHGEVGLVPANYFEIYTPESAIPLYDFPPNNKAAPTNSTVDVFTSPVSSPKRNSGGSPKVTEATLSTSARVVLYDVPPSDPKARGDEPSSRSSPQFGTRSSPQFGARASDTLQSTCSSIPLYDTPPTSRKASSSESYDFPPDAKAKEAIMKVYDTPPSNSRKDDLIDKQPDRESIIPISMDCLFDEDADRLLESLHKEISTSYEELCECVYGPSAIWDKDRRQATLQRTINSLVKFDQSLVNFLEFGKGVSNVLETFKDTHLRMRFNESYSSLLQKRLEILSKYDLLVDGREIVDQITSTVKSLLEMAKTLPGAATELVVLIRANKTILFKQQPRARSSSSLPRALDAKERLTVEHSKLTVARSISATDVQIGSPGMERKHAKRNPKDMLPPLPMEKTTPQEQNYNLLKAKAFAPSTTSTAIKQTQREYEKLDLYEELKWDEKSQANGVHQSRDSHISLNSVGSENDETDYHGSSTAVSGDLEYAESGYFSFDHTPSLNRNSSPRPISKEDQHLLNVFAMQLDAMSLSLVESIDTFLGSISQQGSPTCFVPQSKYTIVCAYKLVYVANALIQKICHGPTKSCIVTASNELVEAIKLVVSDTKTAALQFPSVQATERMTESVNNLNPVASDLVKIIRDSATSPSP